MKIVRNKILIDTRASQPKTTTSSLCCHRSRRNPKIVYGAPIVDDANIIFHLNKRQCVRRMCVLLYIMCPLTRYDEPKKKWVNFGRRAHCAYICALIVVVAVKIGCQRQMKTLQSQTNHQTFFRFFFFVHQAHFGMTRTHTHSRARGKASNLPHGNPHDKSVERNPPN